MKQKIIYALKQLTFILLIGAVMFGVLILSGNVRIHEEELTDQVSTMEEEKKQLQAEIIRLQDAVKEQATSSVKQDNIYVLYWDDAKEFSGEIRAIEAQVIKITKDARANDSQTVAMLVDARGQQWLITTDSLEEGQDVLLILDDQQTPNDIDDDKIIKIYAEFAAKAN